MAATSTSTPALVQALGMYGVDLRRVELMDFDATPVGNALDFIRQHVSWEQYLKQRENEREHRFVTDESRKLNGGQACHPHLQPQADPQLVPVPYIAELISVRGKSRDPQGAQIVTNGILGTSATQAARRVGLAPSHKDATWLRNL